MGSTTVGSDLTFPPLADLRLIPRGLHTAIVRLEESRPKGMVRRAVFDLDNTLLIGDIGDAVFARLLIDRVPLHLTWRQYRSLLAKDAARAYVAVVAAMRGVPLRSVIHATLDVIASPDRELTVEGTLVAIPRPNPVMRAVVALLHNLGYAVHVISASNQTSARIACTAWFGIAAELVHGVRSALDGEVFTDRILKPWPVGAGKRDVYATFVGDDAPSIVGGDSPLDLPLLDLVRQDGLVLWVGDSRFAYEVVKGRLGGSSAVAFVHRSSVDELRPAQAVA